MSDEFITKHEYKTALGEPVYAFTVHCRSEASRKAGIQAQKNRPIEAAYVPFDPEEPKNWPSVYGNESPPPNCQGNNSVGAYIAQAAHDAADGPGDGCSATGCVVPHATDEA